MVTTPMMSQGIPVQLPQAAKQAIDMNIEESTILTITRDGKIYIDDRPIPKDKLEFQLRRLYGDLAVRSVFLRGDRRVKYGEVVYVLDLMKKVGLTKVGMVTELYEGP
jgi:biopolymer transport protein TolR